MLLTFTNKLYVHDTSLHHSTTALRKIYIYILLNCSSCKCYNGTCYCSGKLNVRVIFPFNGYCICLQVSSLLMLYLTVDYAVLAGLSVLFLVLPLNTYLARIGHNTHLEKVDIKDKRVKLMTEILNGIKVRHTQ